MGDFSLASYICLPVRENTGQDAEIAMAYRALGENPGGGSVQGKLLADIGGSPGGSLRDLKVGGMEGKNASVALETSADGATYAAVPGGTLEAVPGGEASFSIQVGRFFRVKTLAGSGPATLQMHLSAQYNEMNPV